MRGLYLLSWTVLLALPGFAQDTPATNSVPSTFRAYMVVDDRFPPRTTPIKAPEDRDPRDRTDKMHCLVCENGLNPTVLVFTRANPAEDGAASKLAKQLDPLVKEFRGNSFNASILYLALEKEYPLDTARNDKGEFLREEKAKQIRDLTTALKTPRLAFGLAPKVSPSYAAWGFADNDETIVVLYNRMQIVKKWNSPTGGPSDDDIKTIMAAVKAEAGK
jgi:hypothetical protein